MCHWCLCMFFFFVFFCFNDCTCHCEIVIFGVNGKLSFDIFTSLLVVVGKKCLLV